MEVRLYGLIAELAKSASLEVDASTTTDLLVALKRSLPELETMSFALAVNRTIVSDEVALTGSEEIALLPPFAGG